MNLSDLVQGAGIAFAVVCGLGIVARLVIACVALRGTTPRERPAILRELPPVFRSFRFGPKLPIKRNDEPRQP